HEYRSYFVLTDYSTNKSNKKAICVCCIEVNKYEVAKAKKDC
ncbi:2565_t:CDS:1, partial [Racocetra fulgida]